MSIQNSEHDPYRGLRLKQKLELIEIDINRTQITLDLILAVLRVINPNNSPYPNYNPKKKLLKLLEQHTFSWQSASSGTVSSMIARLVSEKVLRDFPAFQILRDSHETLDTGESSDWNSYLKVIPKSDHISIQSRVIFLAQTPESIKDLGIINPYRLNDYSLNGIKQTYYAVAMWDFTVTEEMLTKMFKQLQIERDNLDELEDEICSRLSSLEKMRHKQRKMLAGLYIK